MNGVPLDTSVAVGLNTVYFPKSARGSTSCFIDLQTAAQAVHLQGLGPNVVDIQMEVPVVMKDDPQRRVACAFVDPRIGGVSLRGMRTAAANSSGNTTEVTC